MVDFRQKPLKKINGSKVIMLEDYQASTMKNIVTDKTYPLDVPKSNVLIYYTEDGSKIACRPSGTEPKIKFYISVKNTLKTVDDFEKINTRLDAKIDAIINDLNVN